MYRAFMGPFVQMLISAEMIAAFGDDETALVVYDTETALVKSAPGAECVTVKDGNIAYSRFRSDRVPFGAARRAVTDARASWEPPKRRALEPRVRGPGRVRRS